MDLVVAELVAVLSGLSLSLFYYYVSVVLVMTIAVVPAPANFEYMKTKTHAKILRVFFFNLVFTLRSRRDWRNSGSFRWW